MHSLDAPYREAGGRGELVTPHGHPFSTLSPSGGLLVCTATYPLGEGGSTGAPMGYPRVLYGLGREGEHGLCPGRRAGWVCGQEAVKHSEVQEVPETGVQLGG